MKDKRITEHFMLSELVYSQTATAKSIDNTPNQDQVDNLIRLTKNVLEPLRKALDRPITVSSGFRSEELNIALGGAPYSQHMDGEAVDIVCDGLVDAFRYIIRHLYFDQVIFETVGSKSWIHISLASKLNRNEILTYKDGTYTRL